MQAHVHAHAQAHTAFQAPPIPFGNGLHSLRVISGPLSLCLLVLNGGLTDINMQNRTDAEQNADN